MIKTTLMLFFFSAFSYGQDYLNRYEYMSVSKIKQKWGDRSFDSNLFKSSDSKKRAKMVHSLIKNKTYMGQSIRKVFAELGPSTGYFFSESVPAYVIGNTSEKTKEIWQVVFLLSKDSKTIADVRVQKKCCYKR